MQQMDIENRKYLNWFNKIFPFYGGLSDDLLFWVAIRVLFYTVIKDFSGQEIFY